MKKYFLMILVLVLCFCILTACDKNAEEQETDVGESVEMTVYKAAQELGFEGTLEEFLLLVKGADGVGISNIVSNDNNEFIVTLTNGRVITLSTVVPKDGTDGKDGANGRDGVGITNVEINNGLLFVTLSDGRLINCGSIVGEQGGAGRGIASMSVNVSGHLIIVYSDTDTEYDLGKITADDGVTPTVAINGEGYWVINGETTTVKARGENGSNGTNGTNGNNGNNGLSAYQLYCKYHEDYTGTEEQWVEDLVAGNLTSTTYYEVTIDINGNQTVQNVARNDTIDFGSVNTDRPGYSFLRWEKEGEAFDPDTPITGAITIVAVYEEAEITDFDELDELSGSPVVRNAMTRIKITLYDSISLYSGVTLHAESGTIIYYMRAEGIDEPIESHTEANGRDYNIDFTSFYQNQGGTYILDVTYRSDVNNAQMTITPYNA